MRRLLIGVTGVALIGLLAGSVWAATIVGTPKNDTLLGTAKADVLDGKAGNDKLYGRGGNDVLKGGLGNDLLVGGPGSDRYSCGAGKDAVLGGPGDKAAADCESVKGIPAPAPPPPPPTMSVADATVAEGGSGTTTLSFPVTLSAASKKTVTVGFATSDGTAVAGSDYTAASGTLTFNPGETSKTIDVAVTGETAIEPDETLTVTLSSPVNATIADGSATGTITNDDKSLHAGHYAGTTSQGKAIGFDVAADVASLTSFSFSVDLTCTEVAIVLRDFPLTIPGPVAISGGAFGGSFSGGDADGSISGSISGMFASTVTGTLKVDFTVNTDSGPVHCSSGDVTWNAA